MRTSKRKNPQIRAYMSHTSCPSRPQFNSRSQKRQVLFNWTEQYRPTTTMAVVNLFKLALLLIGFIGYLTGNQEISEGTQSLTRHRDKRNIYLNSKSPILIGTVEQMKSSLFFLETSVWRKDIVKINRWFPLCSGLYYNSGVSSLSVVEGTQCPIANWI